MTPNIVMIMADQLRKDCLSAYGNCYVNTPNIDKLINGGMCFNRGYVANPICMPNRNSIISGRMPSNHGVWTNGIIVNDCKKTLTKELKSKNYQTASIGKIHFQPYSEQSAGLSFESVNNWSQMPETDGYTEGYYDFDYVELTIGHTLPCAHYYRWFKNNGGKDSMFEIEKYEGNNQTGIRKMPSSLCSSNFVGERACNYINNKADRNRPFFLTVSFPDPHHPFTSCYDDYNKIKNRVIKEPVGNKDDLITRPEHYMQQFLGQWSRKGISAVSDPNGLSVSISRQRILNTYAMVERIDENVGKVIKALEDNNLIDNTIIILTSDHGELLGDHGLWTKGPFFYEGLINIPVVFYGKGVNQIKTDTLFSSIDFAPTVCELCGVKIPDYTDGKSFADYINKANKSVRDCCIIEYRNGYGSADIYSNVIVTDKYKLVVYENGEMELTDLVKDPEERKNFVQDIDYKNIKNELFERLMIEKLKNKQKGDIQYGHA